VANAVTADLVSLANDLESASGQGIMASAQQILQQSAQRVQAAAQSMAPVKSGALRESISIGYPDPLTAVIGPHVPYAVYQEYGTGSRGEFPGTPYKILPKRPGGVLVFKIGNRTIYARSVTHPGVRPHPFMRPAFRQAMGDQLAASLADAGAALIAKGPNG
jgi:HK97 gp10 family phage protein